MIQLHYWHLCSAHFYCIRSISFWPTLTIFNKMFFKQGANAHWAAEAIGKAVCNNFGKFDTILRIEPFQEFYQLQHNRSLSQVSQTTIQKYNSRNRSVIFAKEDTRWSLPLEYEIQGPSRTFQGPLRQFSRNIMGLKTCVSVQSHKTSLCIWCKVKLCMF